MKLKIGTKNTKWYMDINEGIIIRDLVHSEDSQ